ncbi:hypothetical protein [Methylotenera sp.]|uniref:hypothetical protein n=1 Tax=Methylotenera sp. TaxID=2051956 RepID=UPI002EDA0261
MGFRYTKANRATTPPVNPYWEQATPFGPVTANDIQNTNQSTGGVFGGYFNGGVYSLLLALQNILSLSYGLVGIMSNLAFSSIGTTLLRTVNNRTGKIELVDNADGGDLGARMRTEDSGGNYSEVLAGVNSSALVSDQTASGGTAASLSVANGSAIVMQGQLWTDQAVAPGVLVTTDYMLPVYDATGNLLGYAEIKNPV